MIFTGSDMRARDSPAISFQRSRSLDDPSSMAANFASRLFSKGLTCFATVGPTRGARRVRIVRRIRTDSSIEGKGRFMTVIIEKDPGLVSRLRTALLDWYD